MTDAMGPCPGGGNGSISRSQRACLEGSSGIASGYHIEELTVVLLVNLA